MVSVMPATLAKPVDAVARGLDDALDVVLARDVADDRHDVGVGKFVDQCSQTGFGDVDRDDTATFAGDAGRGGAADAAAGAGHDDGLASEATRHDGLAVVVRCPVGGHFPAVRGEDEGVDGGLGKLAVRERDELLQRQAARGGERFGVGAALGEEAADEFTADGVVQPGADGGGAGEDDVVVRHGCVLSREALESALMDGVRVHAEWWSESDTGGRGRGPALDAVGGARAALSGHATGQHGQDDCGDRPDAELQDPTTGVRAVEVDDAAHRFVATCAEPAVVHALPERRQHRHGELPPLEGKFSATRNRICPKIAALRRNVFSTMESNPTVSV